MTASLDWWDTGWRLLAAAGLGGLLGLERELDGQDAGFRTHMLLSLGAALFGVVSVGAFDMFITERSRTNVTVDVTRIASYVAAGVGFIGGGAIIKHAGVVKGVTTAASLWATAAIGLSSGLGFLQGAVVATGVALVALALLQPVSRLAAKVQRRRPSALLVRVSDQASLGEIVEVMRRHGGDIRSLDVGMADGAQELRVDFWSATAASTDRVIAELSKRDDVVIAQRTRGSG